MTSVATTRVSAYAQAVRDELHDLSPEQAHAVLDGLDDHLAEIVAEGTTDLDEVLGPPAAYAAELRASAGLAAPAGARRGDRSSWAAPAATPLAAPVAERAAVADDDRDGAPTTDEHLASPTPAMATRRGERADDAGRSVIEQAGVRASRLWSDRRVTVARAELIVAFGVLAIVTIRASNPLHSFQILFGAAVVGALWLVLRRAGRRAKLAEPWASRLPSALAVGAIIVALLAGGILAGRNSVYIDNTRFQPTTTLGRVSVPSVPDVVGASVDDARQLLKELGLVPLVKGADGTVGSDMIVSRLTPEPGTRVGPGSVIVIYAAPSSSPSSLPALTTVLVSAVTTANVQSTASTTFRTVPVTATTTPPSSESVATTAVATTAATALSTSTSTPTSTP